MVDATDNYRAALVMKGQVSIWRRFAMKRLVTAMSIGLAIGVCQQALAQASVEKGKSVAIEIPVDSDTACNIEVTRGGEKTNVSVDPNSKKGIYEFAGRELGEETIRWKAR